MRKNIEKELIVAAREAWAGMSDLRGRRRRYKRYTYGDQWSDQIRDDSGRVSSEMDYELRRGRRPMSNNLIRRMVKAVVGRWRVLAEEGCESRDETVAELYRLNNLRELDARALEEFLISGCAIQKIVAEHRPHGSGIWVDNVAPDHFFVNRVRDPRGWDIELIGELRSMSFGEIVMRYCGDDEGKSAMLARVYEGDEKGTPSVIGAEDSQPDFSRGDGGRCRVIEIWSLEAERVLDCHDRERGVSFTVGGDRRKKIEAINKERRKAGRGEIEVRGRYETLWHGRWLAPDGTLLDERRCGRHPYVVKLYPLIDGEVHSLVEDVIDQQIHVNRLITLIDHIMGTSAKGALLFPVKQKAEGISWEDIGRMWSAPDAVIPYAGTTSVAEPRQVTTQGADTTARELLEIQLKMFEDVSGVGQALMGKAAGGGNVGIDRYEAEVRNATITINDLLMTFQHLVDQRDELMTAKARALMPKKTFVEDEKTEGGATFWPTRDIIFATSINDDQL